MSVLGARPSGRIVVRAGAPGVLRCFCLAMLVVAVVVSCCGCGSSSGTTTTSGDSSPGPRVYRASFGFACVDEIDYMRANELSNYLQSYVDGTPVEPEMQAVIDATRFGNTVTLLTASGPDFEASYTLDPASVSKSANNGLTTFTFDRATLKLKAGVPYIEVSARIEPVATSLEQGDGTELSPEQESSFKSPTSFWPADDAEVSRIVQEATSGASSPKAKIEALWRWVRENIRYGGPQGTRYGTMQVIRQGFGRCWDLADVFVTLSRAAGVPARESAGWLERVSGGGGHVWAQAYLQGEGWVSVDCTSDRIGSDTTYVPYLATYDGAMPILYAEFPTFE